MLQKPKFLSAGQFLLTTLIVKLAVMAALATMLARYRRFRHILIFERRDWPDRLVFAAGLDIPLAAGVVARLLLKYEAADLTLEGALLAGLIAGPYTGAIVGASSGCPALFAGEFGALPFAVGCGFAGGGLREAVPKEAHLELLAVRLLQPARPRLADAARAPTRLAGGAAARCRSRSRWSARPRRAVRRRRLFYLARRLALD